MKTQIRKIRSDNRLAALPEAAKNALMEAADAGASLAELCALVRREHGVRVSVSSLSVWLRAAKAEKRLNASVAIAERLASAATDANGGNVDAALTALIKQLALDAALAADDPEKIRMLFDVVIKKQRTDLDARKLAIAERRAQQADAAEKVVAEKTLTPEERERELRRIFRLPTEAAKR